MHAYPGDDVSTTGATIAALVDRGATITVITACDPDVVAETDSPLDRRALGAPGARWPGREPRRYLGSELRDDADDTVPRHPLDGPLQAAELGEISADIAAVVIDVRPDVVVGCSPQPGADRARVHAAARTAAEVLGVPFYVVDGGHTRRGPVRVSGSSAVESFTRVRPTGGSYPGYGRPARIGMGIVAAMLGGFIGATLTVVHQASGPLLPWGIVVAIILSTAFIVGLRIVFETRLVAACGAVGMLAASALLATQSSGGSILVPANPAGYAWTFAPVLITAVVLAWPRLPAGAFRPAASVTGGNVVIPAPEGFDSK